MLERLPIAAQKLFSNLRPDNVDQLHRLGGSLVEAKRYDEAIAIAQRLIELDYNNTWTYDILGKALNGQKRFPEAIVAYEKAIALDSDNSWAYYGLGVALTQIDQRQAAIDRLQQSIRLNPDFAWSYYHLGEVLLDEDRFADAIPVYEKALSLDRSTAFLQPKLEYAQHLQAQKPLDVETLLKHPPKLHRHQGRSVSLGVSTDLARFLARHTHANSHTLETGAGISTIVLMMQQTRHECIIPDPELAERIKAFCHSRHLNTDKLTFHLERSEIVLPQLKPGPLDLVLIDGRHAFPSPFIDWYYSIDHLNIGGICIVDDTQLWTGDVLKQFLKQEAEWELLEEFPADQPTSVAFTKLKSGTNEKWWAEQPYAVEQGPVPAEIV
jgi:tetratricopeptide (TPR) repeat protein